MALKNAKIKGRINEWKTMELLQKEGYQTIRSAASLGLWDVIAWNAWEILYVQVKTNAWPGTVEMQDMYDAVVPPNARKFVHRWDDYQRIPQIRIIDVRVRDDYQHIDHTYWPGWGEMEGRGE